MKRLALASLLCLALPAAAACHQHTETRVWHCYTPQECPVGSIWNQQTLACKQPIYGCFAREPGGPIICVDPPVCTLPQIPVTSPEGYITCQEAPRCRVIVDFLPGHPQSDLIYPVNGAVCTVDNITDALLRALSVFRGL